MSWQHPRLHHGAPAEPRQALEVLRKLQTEKAQEVKEMRLKLDHAKTVKDQAQARVQGPLVGRHKGCSDKHKQASRHHPPCLLSPPAPYLARLLAPNSSGASLVRAHTEAM